MPVTIMAKNYSHCPLKKRPVPVFEECPGKFKCWRCENVQNLDQIDCFGQEEPISTFAEHFAF